MSSPNQLLALLVAALGEEHLLALLYCCFLSLLQEEAPWRQPSHHGKQGVAECSKNFYVPMSGSESLYRSYCIQPLHRSAKQFSEPSMGSMGCPSILIHGHASYLMLRVNDLLLPPRLLLPDLLLHPCQLSL